MKTWSWLCSVGMVVLLPALVLAGAGALTSCGGQSAKFASMKAGPMPEGETWTGVYYNPVYGYLHMIEQDTNIVGRWKRTDASHWGELSGTVDGNVAHFTWKEHAYGSVGPSSDSRGSGAFAYKMGEGKTGELDGEYSLDNSDSVGQWHCVKQTGMKADLNSINGDNPQDTAPAAGDKWN